MIKKTFEGNIEEIMKEHDILTREILEELIITFIDDTVSVKINKALKLLLTPDCTIKESVYIKEVLKIGYILNHIEEEK